MPIAPAPITTSDAGGTVGSQIASLFVQKGPSCQPVDRRNRRLGAGGEHDAIRLDLRAVGELDPVRTDEPRLLEEDADPRAFERGGALAGLRLDHVASALLDGGEVDRHRRDPHAEPTGLAGERRDLRAPQHDLGRDAAVVVALAAELVALGDGDAQARSCRAGTPPRSRSRRRRSRRRRNAPSASSTRPGAEEPDEDPRVDARGRHQVVDQHPLVRGVRHRERTRPEDDRGDVGVVDVEAGVGDAGEADVGRGAPRSAAIACRACPAIAESAAASAASVQPSIRNVRSTSGWSFAIAAASRSNGASTSARIRLARDDAAVDDQLAAIGDDVRCAAARDQRGVHARPPTSGCSRSGSTSASRQDQPSHRRDRVHAEVPAGSRARPCLARSR